MAKAFSVLSWNVEHFGKTAKNSSSPNKPIKPILEFVKAQNADVIAIYEVVGRLVFSELKKHVPGYSWHITEGPQTQEILVGVKKSISCFFTQKVTFKSGSPALRPGALLTLEIDGEDYPLLFLHLKSASDPKGFGLRDDMTDRAIKLRKALDKQNLANGGSGRANFVFLGDLNTMGMNLTYSPKDVTADEEIARLKKRMGTSSVSMEVLEKSVEQTWWPGSGSSYPIGNLDHVVAASHLQFKQFSGKPVDVRGWTDKTTDTQRDDWTDKFSDHALLYFEVQKV